MNPEDFFHQLAREIPEVTEGKMFGAYCLKTPNGKSGAMLWKDCLVVKLQGELLKEALSFDGAEMFEPMEGRTSKDWVQIPYEYNGKWKKFATLSIDAVRELPKKMKKSKKQEARSKKQEARSKKQEVRSKK